MALIKLEDNIREKLEARELKPSAEAWEKLEAKLETEQPKNKSFVWYYMAASFVGILILASVFFTRNTINSEKNQLVKQNVEQKDNIKKENKILPKTINKEEIASEENNSEKSKTEEKQKLNGLKQLPLKKESVIDKKYQKADALAKVADPVEKSLEKETQQSIKKQTPEISEEDKLIKNKVDEVVASVKKLQDTNTEVTAAEVDVLLKNARREIQTQRILKNPKVDATALLQDVELEMEKSFRDKVFDALGEGFIKIRTAVTERNN